MTKKKVYSALIFLEKKLKKKKKRKE